MNVSHEPAQHEERGEQRGMTRQYTQNTINTWRTYIIYLLTQDKFFSGDNIELDFGHGEETYALDLIYVSLTSSMLPCI